MFMGTVQTFSPYYSWLADGFMNGHTWLPQEPPPELLKLADPYDPALNQRYRIQDASLHGGHFYLYFGPVPAILEAPVKFCFGRSTRLEIGDQYPTFVFLLGIVAASGAILARARRLAFPNAPAWSIAVGMLAVGASIPVAWLMSRAAVYECAIAGGQCFLLGGIYFAFVALRSTRPAGWLLLTGICWSCSVGCRLSLAPAVGLLALLILRRLRCQTRPEHSRLPLIALILPLVAGAISLAAYNQARFGSWTQSGWTLQTGALNNHSLQGSGVVISPRYVLPNAFAYLFQLPKISGEPPYLAPRFGAHGLTYLFPRPFQHPLESTAGVVWSVPFLWLGLGFLSYFRRDPSGKAPPGQANIRWLAMSLLSAALAGPVPALFSIYTIKRYITDGSPAAVLFAALASLWLLHKAPDARSRRNWAVVIIVLAAITVRLGLMLSVKNPAELDGLVIY